MTFADGFTSRWVRACGGFCSWRATVIFQTFAFLVDISRFSGCLGNCEICDYYQSQKFHKIHPVELLLLVLVLFFSNNISFLFI